MHPTRRAYGGSSSVERRRPPRPAPRVALVAALACALSRCAGRYFAAARGYLAAAALNQDEALVQWSLVRTDPAIDEPRRLSRLEVAISAPHGGALPADARQDCRASGGEWMCRIDAGGGAAAPADPARYLRPSFTVSCDDSAVAALSRSVAAPGAPDEKRVAAILAWIGANIRKEAADVFTARDVLEPGRAECQGHSYLYAALARAAGIPTRIVNGPAYSEEHRGFLFHTWAESLVEGVWRAVDPTFGQARADATHIVLVEGEAPGDVLALADWVGRTRIRVIAAAPGRRIRARAGRFPGR